MRYPFYEAGRIRDARGAAPGGRRAKSRAEKGSGEREAGSREEKGGGKRGLVPVELLQRPRTGVAAARTRTRVVEPLWRTEAIPDSLISFDALCEANASSGKIWPMAKMLSIGSYNDAAISAVDVHSLTRWCEFMKKEIETCDTIEPEEQLDDLCNVHFMAFHELARQTMITNMDRGKYFLDLWDANNSVQEAKVEMLRLKVAAFEEQTKEAERITKVLELQLKSAVAHSPSAGQPVQQQQQQPNADRKATIMQMHKVASLRQKQSWNHSRKMTLAKFGTAANTKNGARRSSVFKPGTLVKLEQRKSLRGGASTPVFERFLKDIEDDVHRKQEVMDDTYANLFKADENELRVELLGEDLEAALEHISELEEHNDTLEEEIRLLRGNQKTDSTLLRAKGTQTQAELDGGLSKEEKLEFARMLHQQEETKESQEEEGSERRPSRDFDFGEGRKLSAETTSMSAPHETPGYDNISSILKSTKGSQLQGIKWVLKSIWAVYHERIASGLGGSSSLAASVFQIYLRKYGLPAVATRHIHTLVFNAFHHQTHHGVLVFFRFFQGKFDTRLLRIFLHALDLCRRRDVALVEDDSASCGLWGGNPSSSSAGSTPNVIQGSPPGGPVQDPATSGAVGVKRAHEHATKKQCIFPETNEGNVNWVALDRLAEIMSTTAPAVPKGVVQRVQDRCLPFAVSGIREEWQSTRSHIRNLLASTTRVDRDIFLHFFMQELFALQVAIQRAAV